MGKQLDYCPICYEKLEIIDVAPCDDCGWKPMEIEHFKKKEHSYSLFSVYGTVLVLCNFCELDFASYCPEYWGFPKKAAMGYKSPPTEYRRLDHLPDEKLSIRKDKFCPSCEHRLPFLKALKIIRDNNGYEE
jgi:hypothetical protein